MPRLYLPGLDEVCRLHREHLFWQQSKEGFQFALIAHRSLPQEVHLIVSPKIIDSCFWQCFELFDRHCPVGEPLWRALEQFEEGQH